MCKRTRQQARSQATRKHTELTACPLRRSDPVRLGFSSKISSKRMQAPVPKYRSPHFSRAHTMAVPRAARAGSANHPSVPPTQLRQQLHATVKVKAGPRTQPDPAQPSSLSTPDSTHSGSTMSDISVTYARSHSPPSFLASASASASVLSSVAQNPIASERVLESRLRSSKPSGLRSVSAYLRPARLRGGTVGRR